MADTPAPVVRIHCIALHVSCQACGARARIPSPENGWDQVEDLFTRWLQSHLLAVVDYAEVRIGEHTRIFEARVLS